VTRARGGVAAGNSLERVAFVNVGDAPCLLDGFPRVTGVTTSGPRRPIPVRRAPGGTYFGKVLPADIAPRHRGFLEFAGSDICDNVAEAGTRYRALEFVLPARGGTVPAPPHLALTVSCGGLEMTQLGLPEPPALEPPSKPGTPGRLTPRMTAPRSVRVGSTLHFVVTLTNPTKTTVELTPCPRYHEGVATETGTVDRWYRLNCEKLRSIEPHASVRYAMQFRVPADTPAGTTKFFWQLAAPRPPSLAGAITIRR
jgi:hypothetical protein